VPIEPDGIPTLPFSATRGRESGEPLYMGSEVVMRGIWWTALVVLVALGVAGGRLSFARPPDDPKDEKAAKQKAEGGGHGGHDEAQGPTGADKLFARRLDLTIWTLVVFLIVLFILGKYAWAPMMKGLEAREHAIHSAVEEAHRAKEETSRLRDEVVRERAKADEEARATIDQARRDAQKQGDELRAKAVAEIHAERDRMRRDLEIARDAALQDLWSQTAQLATLVSSRAIGREMNADDHRKLVDEAIADIRRAGADRQREVV
jgi:F-type H+-transporting ATPase subunit b